MSDKNTPNQPHYSINCQGKLIDLSTPKVMGILNITPNSFYDKSRVETEQDALNQAEKMLREGATFLDIGGMSSKPGAELITSKEELKRVLPIVKAIRKEFPNSLLSIDTIYSATAKQCILEGANIINDISAGNLDEKMIETVATLHCPYIAMHMKGTPATMKQHTNYDDIFVEITNYFIQKKVAFDVAGIKDYIFDVGFGFAKTIEQNFELLNRMNEFNYLDVPILAGISRKSMIWKTLNTTANEALNGTTALNMVCLQQGASILRVHDVKEAIECITLFNNLNN